MGIDGRGGGDGALRTGWSPLGRRIALGTVSALVLAAGVATWLAPRLASPAWAFATALLAGGLLAYWLVVRRALKPARRDLQALADAVQSFRDHDYSLRLAITRDDELGALARLYNEIADTLQAERSTLFQKELLLETVLQASPVGVVLVNERGRVVLANRAAQHLLSLPARPEGRRFDELLADCPEELSRALTAPEGRLLTLEQPDGRETYLVAHRSLSLHQQRLSLIMVSRLSPELRRQEVEVWKRVIRTMSHELNNSLAPIASLARSAQALLEAPDPGQPLAPLLAVIQERADHLKSFLDGYARLARLPEPRRERVEWQPFLAELRGSVPFRLDGAEPAHPGYFDPVQLQQVLINLLKNAHESGSPPDQVTLAARSAPGAGCRIEVADRGRGLSDEALSKALLPLFSDKQRGGGIGLALCREIVEAHGGRLEIARREGGGVSVVCWLPAAQ